MMHRNIERTKKARNDNPSCIPSELCLPLEFIKGKRSISDHIETSIISKRRLKKLSAKRDGLKKFSNLSFDSPSGSSNKYSSNYNPPAHIQVVLRLCLIDFPLSRVLQVLLEEGISVVNCVSTKVNERLFHTVQTEINDPACLNLSRSCGRN
ncbi:LOW QUALITY PROTEIN: hypothetical protein NC653_030016 [Populus alba x Populus x berolinensis]|uniref:Uncharacterized protein n=1 Tax=Populus alba x Populus x berolinensis TaxID=444605 RepID=A0AAD6Q5Y0_9ROSI|nr:LOW QUALITY PROTEIN: hypothetical protein NC653_030016 [Populus alba x Populus x berolinensis]